MSTERCQIDSDRNRKIEKQKHDALSIARTQKVMDTADCYSWKDQSLPIGLFSLRYWSFGTQDGQGSNELNLNWSFFWRKLVEIILGQSSPQEEKTFQKLAEVFVSVFAEDNF